MNKSAYIPKVTFDGEKIGIPIIDSEMECWLIWREEEDVEEFIKNARRVGYPGCWTNFRIYSKEELSEIDEFDFGTYSLWVYDVYCCETDIQYFLISFNEITDPEDIEHCVCLPFNQLNLLIFFKEYLLPFGGKDFYKC